MLRRLGGLWRSFKEQGGAAESLKLGVLTDLSSVYSDSSGNGAIFATQMAIDDFAAELKAAGFEANLLEKSPSGAEVAAQVRPALVRLSSANPADVLLISLLVGYGAGVAAAVGLRPWIAIPSMIIAIAPTIMAALIAQDLIYFTTAAVMAALLAGGCQSVLRRYDDTRSGMGRRLAFQALARRDPLTVLPNRLALREWFEDRVAAQSHREVIAVLCLDLDNFKPVNDTFGHPIGDLLLQAVADRLTAAMQSRDFVARLGGNEFAVVMRDLKNYEEALLAAQRLHRVVGESLNISRHDIKISASIGGVLCTPAFADLDDLMALADRSLYLAKAQRSGVLIDKSSVGPELDQLAA